MDRKPPLRLIASRPPAAVPATQSLAFLIALAGSPPLVHVSEGALVRVIAATIGDRAFNANELKRHTRLSAELRAIVGSMSPAQIGKALQKLKSKNFDGYVLENLGVDKGGSVWCVKFRG